MLLRDLPIQRKLMLMLLLTSGLVLVLTCCAFIGYEFLSFRAAAVRNLTTLGQVVATNSTAALAFDNPGDATQVLAALKAEPQIVAAALYDAHGALFAHYPSQASMHALPAALPSDGYRFEGASLIGFEAVREGSNPRLGTLYLQSDLQALYEQLKLYSLIAAAMTGLAFLVAYVLSRVMQQQISRPVQTLAQAARVVSEERDYSVRARKLGDDELGSLTDAFNHMLEQIQQRDRGVRESEARLRAVLDSALSAVIVIDSGGRIIDWNPRAQHIFGWTRGEALGRDLAETVIPEPLRDAHRRGLQRFLATGEAKVLNRLIELSGRRRDGSEFPAELFISPLHSDGQVTFCGFVTDVTERKQAREKLQTQWARLELLHRITHAVGERQDLRSIFQVVIRNLEDNLPIDLGCMCVYEPAEHILTVASVGTRSRALGLDVALTQHARIAVDANGLSRCVQGQLVYEPDIASSDYAFARALARGGLRSLIVAPLVAENKVFGVLIAARSQAHAFGSDDCEFLRQLSEHVGLAAHHAKLYEALQRAYDDLRHTQEAVLQQERLRALGQMASGVAHDINNAISPIALYTESLLEREPGLSDRARTYLKTIHDAIHDVAQTVSRMREFYRTREPQLAVSGVDLNRVVRGVLELTRARWRDVPQERGVVIDLRTELLPQPAIVLGAENEIRDALTNLIFNAIDAMPEGGVLTLRTRRASSRGRAEGEPVTEAAPAADDAAVAEGLCLEVSDTGVGMDEETRRRCLEPFFTTKGERGTGMGLAMVYGMAERHGAELQIESAPGRGTTVRIMFPATGETAEDDTGVQLALGPRSLRILMVDDDPLIVESLRETLRSDGHSVTAAEGGQAGIDAFAAAHQQGEAFELVITDLGMPYIDGRQVAAAIRAISPATPIILLTGWGQRLSDEKDIPAHVDRVLNKPPKLRELRQALAELSTRGSPNSAERRSTAPPRRK